MLATAFADGFWRMTAAPKDTDVAMHADASGCFGLFNESSGKLQ